MRMIFISFFSAEALYDADWPSMISAIAFANGIVSWAPAGPFETSCDLNMFKFPYDTQVG